MSLTQRERDLDEAVRRMLVRWPRCARAWAVHGLQEVSANPIAAVRIHFTAIQSTRQAARSLSCAGHAKRRSKIDRTTAQLVREREARP